MPFSEEDRRMMDDALKGKAPPPDPDNDPRLLLNFGLDDLPTLGSGTAVEGGQPPPAAAPAPTTPSIPIEAGGTSGSGAPPVEPTHPLAPLAAPTAPPAEGASSNPAVPSPAVSVSGSGEPNATSTAAPVLNVGATEVSAPQPPPPGGGITHQAGAAGGGAATSGVGRLPLPPIVAPKPSDLSGAQFWQDKLEQAQRDQVAAIHSGDTATADALQRFKDEHAQMVQAHQQANEEAQKQLASQRLAQDQRWQAFQQRDIDPDHYVHNMPGWNKALAIAAMVTGGARAGFEGGPNQALGAFQEAINRDIDAQKANFERDARVLQHGDNLYAQNYQMYRDDAAARAATEADHWQMAKWEIENLRGQSNDDLQKAQLGAAAALANREWETAMARAGQTTALVSANKKVADARKQAEAIAAQAAAGIHTGAGYALATGQPLPKPTVGGGRPSPKAPQTQAAATEAPQVQARLLDPKREKELVPHGKDAEGRDLYILPATAEDKATGLGRGRIVVSTPQGFVETDLGADYQAEAAKGKGAGGGPRFTAREEFADMKQALEDLRTVEPGLKFGEEGARARERYDLIQRSELGRRMGLPELDTSSSDAWDRTRGSLREVIGRMQRTVSERQKLFDQYGDQSAGVTPEDTQ